MSERATSPLSIVHEGDNLAFLQSLPDGCVDLFYADPPFNTGRTRNDAAGSYADDWPAIGSYLEFLRLRLLEMHRVLLETGSILLHCDWRTSHHLRLLLDEVFGPDCFINHLVWAYGLGGSRARSFARKHDDIFFYGKSDRYYFQPPQVPARSVRMRGRMKKATDVLEIPSLNNMALERTGYPTQKPLALLTMLVEACSPPHGLVADVFCGSGTALVAAQQLGRRWLGCDCSHQAVEIAHRRLSANADQQPAEGDLTPARNRQA